MSLRGQCNEPHPDSVVRLALGAGPRVQPMMSVPRQGMEEQQQQDQLQQLLACFVARAGEGKRG